MELPADMTGLNLDKDPEQVMRVSDKLFLLSDLINDNTDSISHPPGTAEMRYDTKNGYKPSGCFIFHHSSSIPLAHIQSTNIVHDLLGPGYNHKSQNRG